MAKQSVSAPVALAFAVGNQLPPLNANSISVQIITTLDAAGNLASANLQINYQIDPAYITIPPKATDPKQKGTYQIPNGKTGLAGNEELFNAAIRSNLNIEDQGGTKVLNASLPLLDPIKRYVEDFRTSEA